MSAKGKILRRQRGRHPKPNMEIVKAMSTAPPIQNRLIADKPWTAAILTVGLDRCLVSFQCHLNKLGVIP